VDCVSWRLGLQEGNRHLGWNALVQAPARSRHVISQAAAWLAWRLCYTNAEARAVKVRLQTDSHPFNRGKREHAKQ